MSLKGMTLFDVMLITVPFLIKLRVTGFVPQHDIPGSYAYWSLLATVNAWTPLLQAPHLLASQSRT
jgi:hypothetical protein